MSPTPHYTGYTRYTLLIPKILNPQTRTRHVPETSVPLAGSQGVRHR